MFLNAIIHFLVVNNPRISFKKKNKYVWKWKHSLSLPNIVFHLLKLDGSCVLPLDWDGKWYDSGNGNITFDNSTSTISSGWSLTTHGSTLNSWTCMTSNSTGNLLLFRYGWCVPYFGVFQILLNKMKWTAFASDFNHSFIHVLERILSWNRLGYIKMYSNA